MNQTSFDHLRQQSQRALNQQIDIFKTDQNIVLYLAPEATFSIQQALNSDKQLVSGDIEGVMLEPIRQPHQVLYRLALNQHQFKDFNEEEQFGKNLFEEPMSLIKSRISQEQFYCFLTLDLMRCNPLSKYFIRLPDQLFLKLSDYESRVFKPLDMFSIAHKLLRGEYKDSDEFQVEIVTMINNFKIYFANDFQMFDIAIRFEQVYWHIHLHQIHKYSEAVQKYKQISIGLKKPTVRKAKQKPKDYSYVERISLNSRVKRLSKQMQVRISKYLMSNCQDSVENRKQIYIDKLSNKHIAAIEQMINQQEALNAPYDEQEEEEMIKSPLQRQGLAQKLKAQNWSPDDFNFGDSDDED